MWADRAWLGVCKYALHCPPIAQIQCSPTPHPSVAVAFEGCGHAGDVNSMPCWHPERNLLQITHPFEIPSDATTDGNNSFCTYFPSMTGFRPILTILQADRHPVCRVIAWEPVPQFRAFLEYGIALNNLTHLITIRWARM